VQYTNQAAAGTSHGNAPGQEGCAGEEVDKNPRHSRRFDAVVLRLVVPGELARCSAGVTSMGLWVRIPSLGCEAIEGGVAKESPHRGERRCVHRGQRGASARDGPPRVITFLVVIVGAVGGPERNL